MIFFYSDEPFGVTKITTPSDPIGKYDHFGHDLCDLRDRDRSDPNNPSESNTHAILDSQCQTWSVLEL